VFRISGLTPLHELEEQFNLQIDNDEVSTFGGLITAELGCIPKRGERLSTYGLQIEITDVDDRRIISTLVTTAGN
jgi:magnesium and cobalt transporter